MHAINIENLSGRYDGGSPLPVFEDLNLQISSGEFVCLTGPSGCGKSTLIRMICGFLKPDSGTIYSYGKQISEPTPSCVMVFQEDSTFPWMTVRENVEFGLKMAKIPAEKRHEIASMYLNMVNMHMYADQYVKKLSVGQRQRVSIARALALDPNMLLMDEPFSALDAKTKGELMFELQMIWQKTKKTILFVTHDPLEAATLGTRILRFTARPGKIVEDISNDLPMPRTPDAKEVIAMATHIKKGITR